MLRLESAEPPCIAAVDGSDGIQVQRMFAALVHAWQHAGIRVGGVIEETHISSPGMVCGDLVLRDLADGAIYPNLTKAGTGLAIMQSGFRWPCLRLRVRREIGAIRLRPRCDQQVRKARGRRRWTGRCICGSD